MAKEQYYKVPYFESDPAAIRGLEKKVIDASIKSDTSITFADVKRLLGIPIDENDNGIEVLINYATFDIFEKWDDYDGLYVLGKEIL